jgi:hypothetical protein
MTAISTIDADRSCTPRAVIEQELRRLRMLCQHDASDDDLRARIAELEVELAAHDARAAR